MPLFGYILFSLIAIVCAAANLAFIASAAVGVCVLIWLGAHRNATAQRT